MSTGWRILRRWMRDRRLSTLSWTAGLVVIVVITAAFYPSLSSSTTELGESSSGAMSALLGLSSAIDPSSPLGYLWIGLYANVVPMTQIAFGIALGSAAIAGDEETGTLEYMLSMPVTRGTIAVSRFVGALAIMIFSGALVCLSLIASIPLFELGDEVTTTAADGSTTTQPGATALDAFNGTLASTAVGLGFLGLAYALGGITGRKGPSTGITAAIAVGGYVLYTISNSTGSLDWLAELTPWKWYVDDASLVLGLSWAVIRPVILAAVGFVVGAIVFTRRDLQPPK
ncbi:MAG: ABC transporter permease subunit [Actinomycetota bacterium]